MTAMDKTKRAKALRVLQASNDSGTVHKNKLTMQEAVAREFGMAQVKDLSLLDLCDLYVEIVGKDD